jgi:hypothetical protein
MAKQSIAGFSGGPETARMTTWRASVSVVYPMLNGEENIECSLFRGGRPEYDKFSDPVSVEVLEKHLLKLKELGTFGISLTGCDAPYS